MLICDWSSDVCSSDLSEALKKAITPHTCAFLIEAIQGEAGIVIPPVGWLKTCQEICNKHDVLFIIDEVQTGLAGTGKRFAFEHENVKPDEIKIGVTSCRERGGKYGWI